MLSKNNVYDSECIFPICHTVIKGKYTKEGVKFFRKENFAVDYTKRKKMSFAENLKMRMIDMIPRKTKDRLKKVLKKIGFKFYAE